METPFWVGPRSTPRTSQSRTTGSCFRSPRRRHSSDGSSPCLRSERRSVGALEREPAPLGEPARDRAEAGAVLRRDGGDTLQWQAERGGEGPARLLELAAAELVALG